MTPGLTPCKRVARFSRADAGTLGLVLLGHGLGHVSAVRKHIELLVLAVVILSVLPLAYEVTRHRRATRS